MKKFVFTLCLFIGFHALAGETIKTVDIVNNSDIPVTVTYDECYMDSSNVSICNEKTTTLSNKNGGTNYVYIDASNQEKQQSALQKEIVIKKIVSALGVQEFLSYADYNKIYKELTESKLLGVMPN